MLAQAVAAGLKLDMSNGRAFIDDAMSHAWMKVAEEVASTGRRQGVDLSFAVHQSADAMRKKLQALTESLQKANTAKGCELLETPTFSARCCEAWSCVPPCFRLLAVFHLRSSGRSPPTQCSST